MQISMSGSHGKTFPINHIPPTAFPIGLRGLAAGLLAAFNPSRTMDRFQEQFALQIGTQRFHFLASGRLALTMILLAIKEDSSAQKVLIPAYGCSTILQAILEADLEPEFCDVSLETLDFDQAELERKLKGELLAVIGVHLYGLTHDYSDLVDKARSRGLIFIEDAAQSFGASVLGKPVGTQGDIGFYSLGKGKCLPAGGGGVIVSEPEYEEKIAEALNRNPLLPSVGLQHLALMGGYLLAVNPFGWWFISRSRFNPAQTGNDLSRLPEIKYRSLSVVQAGLANYLLGKIPEVYQTWIANAHMMLNGLREIDYLGIPVILKDVDPVFLRLPVVVDNEERTQVLFTKLQKAGIGVSRSYRYSLPKLYQKHFNGKIDDQFQNAACLSKCLLTLPTNGYVNQRKVEEMIRIFKSV